MTTFTGIIPAAIVPFTADDAVDLDAYKANVAHVIEHGANGVVANGTMGEAGQLSNAERDAVLRAAVEVAGGRVPVVAGVSSGTTAISVAYAEAAKAAGASGVMCLPPLNYRGTPEEITAFFTAVAAVGLPVMLYNNPEASATDLPAEQIAAIAAAVPGIVAVKECSGDARRIAALVDATDLDVLVGGDDWALEGFAAGAVGWVSGVANVGPAECVALQEAVAAGRLDEARALNTRLLPLARLDMTPWLVQYFKAAMDEVGLTGGPVRAPRLALSETGQEVVRAAVSALREPVAA
jgi:4-hydroxy-tetrahydrodipicolinate synthase